MVEELDWSVGEILAALQKHGLDEQTLVIFSSDNGPFLSYGEHAGSAGPLREGKLTTFEGGVRMPCIVRWPGQVPAETGLRRTVQHDGPLRHARELIGAKLPDTKIDGKDVRPLLFGEAGRKGRDEFWYYSGDELHAVRQGDWKLHLPHEYLTVAGRTRARAASRRTSPTSSRESIEQSGIRGIASRHGYASRRSACRSTT